MFEYNQLFEMFFYYSVLWFSAISIFLENFFLKDIEIFKVDSCPFLSYNYKDYNHKTNIIIIIIVFLSFMSRTQLHISTGVTHFKIPEITFHQNLYIKQLRLHH